MLKVSIAWINPPFLSQDRWAVLLDYWDRGTINMASVLLWRQLEKFGFALMLACYSSPQVILDFSTSSPLDWISLV